MMRLFLSLHENWQYLNKHCLHRCSCVPSVFSCFELKAMHVLWTLTQIQDFIFLMQWNKMVSKGFYTWKLRTLLFWFHLFRQKTQWSCFRVLWNYKPWQKHVISKPRKPKPAAVRIFKSNRWETLHTNMFSHITDCKMFLSYVACWNMYIYSLVIVVCWSFLFHRVSVSMLLFLYSRQ